jgi:hypothetical protein
MLDKTRGNDSDGNEPFESADQYQPLLDYLSTSNCLHVSKTGAPILTRHDRGGSPGEPLSSHCYARNLKRYAREAGIERFHLHQTSHTFARIVAE